MSSSAEAMAATISAPQTTESEEAVVEEVVVEPTEEVETPEDSQESETEEEEVPELPDAVKDILKKNRKSLREAEARAAAAEKALATKDTPEGESAPADTHYKDLYLKTAAKAALVEAGLTTGTDKFLKMLDLSGVEVDEDGAITGLEDQIADIKDDFADILAPKKKTVKVDAAGRRTVAAVPKSSAEILAQRFNNG